MSLTVSVSGNPAPKITWSVQGKTHGEQSRYKITADKFEISEVRFEDQGMITCRAENLFGVREAGVKLIVFGKIFFDSNKIVKNFKPISVSARFLAKIKLSNHI